MSCCVLCGVESLEDDQDADEASRENEIWNLILLYLPFYDVIFFLNF